MIAKSGQTGPWTTPVKRSTTAVTPMVSAIVSRRDACQTTISALLSSPTRGANGDLPSIAPTGPTFASPGNSANCDGACAGVGEAETGLDVVEGCDVGSEAM